MISDGTVGGVTRGAPTVSYSGSDHAFDDSELGIGTPESAQAKGGCFDFDCCVMMIDGKNGGRGQSIFGRENLGRVDRFC